MQLAAVGAWVMAAALAGEPDSIRIEDPRPADRHHVDRYTCADEDDVSDVVVEYRTWSLSPTEHRSEVERIVIDGRALTMEELARINAFASAGTVHGSSAACASSGIRVAIDIFDADAVEPGDCLDHAHAYVQVYLDRRTSAITLP